MKSTNGRMVLNLTVGQWDSGTVGQWDSRALAKFLSFEVYVRMSTRFSYFNRREE
jgi:hypothetical protein